MNEVQTAVDSIFSALTDMPKGLSMKEAKQLIGKAFGIKRVGQTRLLPVLELGKELELFNVQDNCIVSYILEVPVSRNHLMSRDAKEYYDKAIKTHRIYVNQLEMYLDYCEECIAVSKEPAHPRTWVIGDIE